MTLPVLTTSAWRGTWGVKWGAACASWRWRGAWVVGPLWEFKFCGDMFHLRQIWSCFAQKKWSVQSLYIYTCMTSEVASTCHLEEPCLNYRQRPDDPLNIQWNTSHSSVLTRTRFWYNRASRCFEPFFFRCKGVQKHGWPRRRSTVSVSRCEEARKRR